MEFIFRGADGTRLVARSWEPPSVQAVLLVVHGLGEYGAKYVSLASEMNKNNVAVCAMDLRGFGVSDGRRGHAETLDVLVSDVQALVQTARGHYDAPLFIMGHSMGGVLAAHAAAGSPLLDGLILSSPWIGLRYRPPLPVRLLLELAGSCCPKWRVRFDVQQVESGKKTVPLTAYADERVHRWISAGLYRALRQGANAMDKGMLAPGLPLLGLHGAKDRLTDPVKTETFVRRCGGRFRLWPNGGHTLHRGEYRREFCQEMANWISEIIQKMDV